MFLSVSLWPMMPPMFLDSVGASPVTACIIRQPMLLLWGPWGNGVPLSLPFLAKDFVNRHKTTSPQLQDGSQKILPTSSFKEMGLRGNKLCSFYLGMHGCDGKNQQGPLFLIFSIGSSFAVCSPLTEETAHEIRTWWKESGSDNTGLVCSLLPCRHIGSVDS